MRDETPLLEVLALRKHFPVQRGFVLRKTIGTIRAVDNVSFRIDAGETLALVGESGSGKSTVGRTVLRLLEPTDGQILLEGRDFRALEGRGLRTARRRLQMIFQDPYASINPRLTVERVVSEPLDVAGELRPAEIRDRVSELLERVGLGAGIGDRYPHEFSGGQRQRIGIARALALNPRLIVCDEVVASLDVSIQAQIINLLQELQEQYRYAYLFISHDLGVVRHVSDRVAVMYLGKLMEVANADAIFEQPVHPYTEALLSAIPVPDPEVEASRRRILLEGDIPSAASPPGGCVFRTRCPRAVALCAQSAPAFREVRPGHFAACHLVEPPASPLPEDR